MLRISRLASISAFFQSSRSPRLRPEWGERSSIRSIDDIVRRSETFKRLRTTTPSAPAAGSATTSATGSLISTGANPPTRRRPCGPPRLSATKLPNNRRRHSSNLSMRHVCPTLADSCRSGAPCCGRISRPCHAERAPPPTARAGRAEKWTFRSVLKHLYTKRHGGLNPRAALLFVRNQPPYQHGNQRWEAASGASKIHRHRTCSGVCQFSSRFSPAPFCAMSPTELCSINVVKKMFPGRNYFPFGCD